MLRDRPTRHGRPEASALARRATAALAAFLTAGTLAASAATVGATDGKAKAIAAEKPPVLSLNDALIHDAASPMLGNPHRGCHHRRLRRLQLRLLQEERGRPRGVARRRSAGARHLQGLADPGEDIGGRRQAPSPSPRPWQGKYAEMHKALIAHEGASRQRRRHLGGGRGRRRRRHPAEQGSRPARRRDHRRFSSATSRRPTPSSSRARRST